MAFAFDTGVICIAIAIEPTIIYIHYSQHNYWARGTVYSP